MCACGHVALAGTLGYDQNMRSALALLLCLALAVPAYAAQESYEAVVLRVSDGASMLVRTTRGKRIKIRLYGIAAPEVNQPWGAEAKDALRQLLWETVTVQTMGDDAQKGAVAIVSYMGRCINLELAAAGNAWLDPKYCKAAWVCGQIKMAEAEARAQRKGLWADERPVAPWEWRKRK